MTKLGVTVLLLVLLLAIGALVYLAKNYDNVLGSPAPSASPTATPTAVPTATPTPLSDLIQVDFPQDGDLVASPLTVYGQVRGTWFFESSFGVKLLDADDKVLAQGSAQADVDEWRTTEFVPFTAKLTFQIPTTATGTLLLQQDDPSGLPGHTPAELRVPVVFSVGE